MKNRIVFILILAFLVVVSLHYGGLIKKNILFVNDFVVGKLYDLKEYTSEAISKHFNQAEQISSLKEKNKELEHNAILAITLSNELNRLLEDKNSTQYFPKISLVRAMSYVQMNDYRKVWLDSLIQVPSSKSAGLIYKGYTAGIAINKDGRIMAILQGDEQCSFSVYIGEDKFPGVVQGQNGKILVKFIPKYSKIKVGDEILTSGLDNIFFSGIPVGVITQIIDEDMYLNAEVKPYIEVSIPVYLYIVEHL